MEFERKKRRVEILAPAGSWESLTAGIYAGADAVYLGGSRFGARAYADNLEEEFLLRAIDHVHLHGRKIYLTVNTLLKDSELAELYDYLLPYYRQGLDAVIVQDTGVMRFIKRQFPGLSVHVSTQATVTHALGAAFYERAGADRIVPARELSLEEIRHMKKETGLEIECFVHGAMCYCYSGQCLMSSMIGGRSGNRGQCAQPCRLPYSVNGQKPQDILSLKDMCTIGHIPELADAGIDSFKIEGRMKQPEYVYTVVKMYRKYVDLYYEKGKNGYYVTREDQDLLESVYQRRGYCDGYYNRQNGREMLAFQRPAEKKVEINFPQDFKIKEKINGDLILSEGKHATLCMEYKREGINIHTHTEGAPVQTALKAPLDKKRIKKQLEKTGNTEFVFDRLGITINGNVFLPMQALNELRRNALTELENAVLSSYRRETPPVSAPPVEDSICISGQKEAAADIVLETSVQTEEQFFETLKETGISSFYVDGNIAFTEKVLSAVKETRKNKRKVYIAMPHIFRERTAGWYEREKRYEILASEYDGVLIRNFESFEWLRRRNYRGEIISDHNLYMFNRESREFLKETGIVRNTMPAELNKKELKDLGAGHSLVVYGFCPVMVTANCIRKSVRTCERKEEVLWLLDRRKKKFAVKNYCKYCYNIIYNCTPLHLADMAEEVKETEPYSVRLDFTIEDAGKTKEVLCLYKKAFKEHAKVELPVQEYTRGHFKRGVK